MNEREKKIYKAAVIDTSSLVEAQARDIGDHKMTESKEDRSKGWFSRTTTRIWNHNLAQEYYRQKEITNAKKQIIESGNLYAGEEEGESARHQEAMGAIIDRFTSEYDTEMLKDEERASKEKLDAVASAQIRELIKTYAGDPDMGKDAFKEEQTRILSSINPAYADAGKQYADNLFQIATEVRRSVEHGQSLQSLDFDVELTLGRARESLNTESQRHTFDRVTEKLQNSRVGRFIANSPALLAIGAGAYSLAKFAGLSALRSNVAKAFTFGGAALVAGGVAGLKESARLERERSQHTRERAKGMKFEDDAERREEMDKNRYETRPAKEYIDSLESGLAKVTAGNIETSEARNIVKTLAELESRITLGDRNRADFIEYSRFDQVEQERTKLDLLRAKLKVALRNDPKVQSLSGGNFNEYLKGLAENESTNLEDTEVSSKDAIFKKMKHAKVAKTVATTVLLGAAAGFAAQEIGAEVGSALGGHTDGFFSGLVKSGRHFFGSNHETTPTPDLEKHATSLEALRRYMTGESPRMPFGHGHEMTLGPVGTHVKMPEGVEMHANPDGTYNIVRQGDVISSHEHIVFDKVGNLTPETQAALAKHDIFSDFSLVHGTATEHFTESPADYIKETAGAHNPHVHRELWYDNDTPKPHFDKNELKEWWGGAHNTGVDKDGNYVFDMKHMMPKGSYHADQSVDAPAEIKTPGLKMLFSMSRDTQHQPFELEIKPDGTAIIPKDSEMAKLMFENVNGHAVFKGQFAEVAQSMGAAKDGAENVRILSTVVGHGLKSLDRTHLVPTTIPTLRIDAPDSWDFTPPPFIPVPLARTPLERGTSKYEGVLKPVDVSPYYDFVFSPEQKLKFKQELSPTLRDNPDAKLDPRTEINSYLEKQTSEYRESLQNLAQQAGPMSPDCKLSICIPVAGHQEENNIERTLSSYLNQTADPKSFEIVLFINQPATDREGNPVTPDSTAEKVKAFQEAHLEMNLKVMNMTLPVEEAKIGNIRKLLNDVTLLRSSNRSTDAELVMVSNDADTKGVAPEYIQNFINKFSANQNIDASLGQLDWDPESYIRNPLVHVGTRLMQYMDVQSRRMEGRIGSSGGNFAFRSSVYAAIGGYNGNSSIGEDIELGRKIKYAREGSSEHTMPIVFGGARVSRLYTSSRRAEKVLMEGMSPLEQWNQGFGAFDDKVRQTNWEDFSQAPDYNNPEVVKDLVSKIEMIVNRTLSGYSGMDEKEFKAYTRRSLGWLGIKYSFSGKYQIKITDSSKLIEGLKEYQTEGLKMMQRKLTKPESKASQPKDKPRVRVKVGSRPTPTNISPEGQKPRFRVQAQSRSVPDK